MNTGILTALLGASLLLMSPLSAAHYHSGQQWGGWGHGYGGYYGRGYGYGYNNYYSSPYYSDYYYQQPYYQQSYYQQQVIPLPSFSLGVENATVVMGAPIVLRVSPSGVSPFKIMWRVNNSDWMSGGTTITYQASQAGYVNFTVFVQDANGNNAAPQEAHVLVVAPNTSNPGQDNRMNQQGFPQQMNQQGNPAPMNQQSGAQ